jgi:hypothetical protein
MRVASSLARKDIEGVTKPLIDAKMKVFGGLHTPVVQNIVVDMILGLGITDAFRIFTTHIRDRYGAEPGFITMSLPILLDALDAAGIDNPIVCTNVNKIGFRMCGGLEGYHRALAERRFSAVAMSVFASGAIPVRKALEWVYSQPHIQSIVFGASSRANIHQTRVLADELANSTR